MKRMPVVKVPRPCDCEAWPFCEHQQAIDEKLKKEREFFSNEEKAGTLTGAVLQNPSSAVRVLGPLETIRIGCGGDK